ncbi:MAG: VOC family protein [Pseudomonadales bacterium]
MNAKAQETLSLPPLDQIGFVVKDLDAAIRLYEPLFGPFSIMEPGSMSWSYRGKEEESELKLAFGKSGNVEIELIEWLSGECPHKEFIDEGLEGMHHLRYIVEDLESSVGEAEALGYISIWQKRLAKGLAAAYLQRDGDPLIIEFYENHRMSQKR